MTQLFKTILQNAQSSGEFSVSEEATELPALPHLYVQNFGLVPLPLNELQAEHLIRV